MGFRNEIQSEVTIDATADEVWAVLTDFDSYGDWNPGFVSARGRAEVGTRLDNVLRMKGERTIRMRPTVLVAEPGRELRWLGRLFVPGLFDGEHRFEIREAGSGSIRFVQAERFRGVLVPFMRSMIEGDTLSMFKRVNQALAARVAAERSKA